MQVIPIYIATSARFAACEPVIKYSIEKHSSSPTTIRFISPESLGVRPTGCTGFSNLRYLLPHLLREDGYEYGIYLDVDMLLLADITELYGYRRAGKWVCLEDWSTEVSVVSVTASVPSWKLVMALSKHQLASKVPMLPKIPLCWNSEDSLARDTKLLHFTDLKRQPWFAENDRHHDARAVALWERYQSDSEFI